MGTTKALIVGVSEYFIDGADNLFFCKNDIIAMQDAFIYGLEVVVFDMIVCFLYKMTILYYSIFQDMGQH